MDKYLKQFVTKLFHTESRLLSPAIYASEFYINRGTYSVNKKDRASLISNRPFYRYGGHIELFGIEEYYGMPGCPEGGGGRGRAPVFTRAFRENFSLSSPRKRLQWEKKIVVPCLDVIMIASLPINNH